MGAKAARKGDMTDHTTGLNGAGCGTVKIEGANAWRVGDFHSCSMQNCPPPPAPPVPSIPHVGGVVLKGSFTVLINNQPAARQGDFVFEPAAIPPTVPPPPMPMAGPPKNNISMGATNTEIGDFAFGVVARAVLEQFCKDWKDLRQKWPSLTPDERKAAVKSMLDKALQTTGSPPLNAVTDAAGPNALADFSPGNFNVNMPSGFFNGATPPGNVAQTLIHEIRHAEQAFNDARYLAGQGMSGAQIRQTTGIPQGVADAAAANPAGAGTAAGQHGEMYHDHSYGANRPVNDAVRDEHTRAANSGNSAQHQAAYDAYFGLPEEADSRDAERALAALCPESR